MKKFAFIDFHNTDGTTKKLHGFGIDWIKLYEFLVNQWKCEQVFFYIGVDDGDLDTVAMINNLTEKGCIVRAKTVFAYKNKDKEISINCPSCGNKFIERIDMGYNKKSNCDVDLTVDAMELSRLNSEFYLFTGDGDFDFLIKNAISKGIKVVLVSSAKKINSGHRYFTSRLSTKLRKVLSEYPKEVNFIEINNLKIKIEKK
ncbi:MAG: NYN domain-containing protein [Candidatus Staskawiczbacteria bacterium]|nr:NYN domain-containing protein [Candidatus Staskawiczbacteria bacterium]MBI3337194.1 NYN domain-containing protein [Candidatus Staskawiczbacteria bacterium]